MSHLRDRLFNEILLARQRVYTVREPTPLESLDIGSEAEVWVKREDQPPIYAYKWRGAFNRMATLTPEQLKRGVACASAGNHAQGVALAARFLGCHATIFMPRPTPEMKRHAVAQHGGDAAVIKLVGDTYDQAYQAARDYAKVNDLAFVHPYDDLVTMGGQGTIADEVVMSGKGPFDYVYLQIGGGGMAAAVACWLKHYMPHLKVIGVEAEGQASMQAAIKAGKPTTLEKLDIFCDGTAVQRTGEITFPLCQELIDEFITVSNQEVSNAIRQFWNWRRRIVEPAGALGLAGLLSQKERLENKRVLAITCGANMDFSQLALIAAEAGIGGQQRHHLRFKIEEQTGSLLSLMRETLRDCNIVEFQYGKASINEAFPVIGFDASPYDFAKVMERCVELSITVEDVSEAEDTHFRVVPFNANLLSRPLLFLYEFPERVGALHEFLEQLKGAANLCYLNYKYSGERVGRALVGLEFESAQARERLLHRLESDEQFRGRHQLLSQAATQRLLGTSSSERESLTF